MKKTKRLTVIVTIVLSAMFNVGCSLNTMQHNLIIVNNSDDNLRSIGFSQDNSSGNIYNGDGSFIKPGQELKVYVKGKEVILDATDEFNNQYVSSKLDINFEDYRDTICRISIEPDSSGALDFVLCE